MVTSTELVMLLRLQMMMVSSCVRSVRGEHEDVQVLGTAAGGPNSWAQQEEVSGHSRRRSRYWHSRRRSSR
jgi:hypothetical protein